MWVGVTGSRVQLNSLTKNSSNCNFLCVFDVNESFRATKKFKEQLKKTDIAFQAMVISKMYSDIDIFGNFRDMVVEIESFGQN